MVKRNSSLCFGFATDYFPEPSVIYTAPAVQANNTVTITASFASDESYLRSSYSSTGMITPAFALSDLYEMTFNAAVMTNVTFRGPFLVDGMNVTNVRCNLADVTGFTLSHLGLNSSTFVMSNMKLHVTYFKAYSSDSNSTFQVMDGQEVNLAASESANLTNGVAYIIRFSATSANLTQMEAVGERARVTHMSSRSWTPRQFF